MLTVGKIFIFLMTLLPVFAAPEVIAVFPISQATAAERSSDIIVDFSDAIDTTSISGSTFMVNGRYSGIITGTFQFENRDTRIRFTPDHTFAAGEFVTVSLSKGVRDSGGQPMDYAYSWGFWAQTSIAGLYIVESQRIEVREPGEGWIQTYGANGVDLNGDGYSDYSVPNELSNDVRVFLNDGNGSYNNFTIHPLPNANRPSTNESADFNQDGNIDIAVGSTSNATVNVLLGDGAGGFISIDNYTASSGVRGLTTMDLNGDGWIDIVTTNRNGNNVALLLNNGDGTFAPAVTINANTSGETSCAAGDANNDGIMDLFVGSRGNNEIILMLGDGNGSLAVADTVDAGGDPWMLSAGDVDGDGNVDVVAANSNASNVAVVRSDGNGGLLPATNYPSGGNYPLAVDLGDIDGDGDLDMMASNFFGPDGNPPGIWRMYENLGDGTFAHHQDYEAAGAASCAVFHDRDNDGDLDVTGIDEVDDLLFLFDNAATTVNPEDDSKPSAYTLLSNYPNPFNPGTDIGYRIPDAGYVELAVFDILGRKVRKLVNQEKAAGSYTVRWDGRNDVGEAVAGGVYLYRITAGDFTAVRKMLLVR